MLLQSVCAVYGAAFRFYTRHEPRVVWSSWIRDVMSYFAARIHSGRGAGHGLSTATIVTRRDGPLVCLKSFSHFLFPIKGPRAVSMMSLIFIRETDWQADERDTDRLATLQNWSDGEWWSILVSWSRACDEILGVRNLTHGQSFICISTKRKLYGLQRSK